MTEEAKKRFFVGKMIFILMLTVGLGIFITWVIIAVTYGDVSVVDALTDIGLYSFTIVFVLFGLFGLLLYRAREKEAIDEE